MRPERFRKGGLGEKIRYLIADCPLGQVLVAETERGLCAVTLGDDVAAMERDLHERFPAAEIESASIEDARLGETTRAVISRMTEHPVSTGSAARFAGDSVRTAGVAAAASIPRGETRSYSAVAAELGQPRAVRAVARACARNPVALVVPCHRGWARTDSSQVIAGARSARRSC